MDDLIGSKFSKFFYPKNRPYYLMQEWSDDDADPAFLKLTLTDCSSYWSGTYKKSEVINASNSVEYGLDDVKLAFKQAFSKETRYSITLTPTKDFVKTKFTLKQVSDDDIKVEIISLNMEIIDDPSPRAVFDFAIDRIDSLESELRELKIKNKKLDQERKEAMEVADKLLKDKENMECDLYEKFIEILNQKKLKLRELINNEQEQEEEQDQEREKEEEKEDDE